MTIKDGIGN